MPSRLVRRAALPLRTHGALSAHQVRYQDARVRASVRTRPPMLAPGAAQLPLERPVSTVQFFDRKTLHGKSRNTAKYPVLSEGGFVRVAVR